MHEPNAMRPAIDRRAFVASALVGGMGALTGCSLLGSPTPLAVEPGGRLSVKHAPPTALAPSGLQPLGLSTGRDATLYVPTDHKLSEPLPLMVLFHGAGGEAANWFGSYDDRGESARIIMLAIDSRGYSWDVLFIGHGPDVAFVDDALAATFDRCAVRADRISCAGFSDGATYSLAIGLTNGDLFSHVIAYSAGGLTGIDRHGAPRVFASHGVQDPILPVGVSQEYVPRLRAAGYDVSYHDFQGGHEVPPAISSTAIAWLLQDYLLA